MKQRLIVCIAAVMLALMHGVCTYAAIIDSGKCGDNVMWKLDDKGLLAISGTGDMYDYDYIDNLAPWYGKRYDITVVSISEGVSRIGDYAFRGFYLSTSVDIPNSVIEIGSYAFSGCSSLTSIEIPDAVIEIGSSAFSGCSSLTSIEIPDAVTRIADSVFSGCSSLASIKIPDAMTSIGNQAFSGCSSLANIEIPAKVSYIGESAFSGCSSLTNIKIPDAVTRIGSYAFFGCSSLTSIEIPDAVTRIADSVFSGCSSLASIKIPDAMTSIGNQAFSGCSSLANIEIPAKVSYIGESAFSGCSSLTNIEIPANVYSIGEYAFSNCSSLTNIAGVGIAKEIKEGTFKGCRNLTSVYLPSFVGSIGDMAFARCSNLSKVVCEAVEPPTCGSNAFYGVNRTTCQLEVIEQSIDKYKAADQWKDFVNIAATTVRKCGDNIVWMLEDGNLFISGTGEMYDYYEPYTNTYLWGNLIKTVTISDGVTNIGGSAFYQCIDLISIEIPSSVIEIGFYAFGGCGSLASVTIPSSVTTIGKCAFRFCSSLVEIKCEAIEPPSCDEFVFDFVNTTDCKLYVPEESIEKYRTADQWKDFANIIGLAGVDDVANDSEVTVNVTGNMLVVDGADAGEMLEVYSAAGAAVYRGPATSIALPGAGIYIVKIAGKVLKLAAN